jgi:hypothetical protein
VAVVTQVKWAPAIVMVIIGCILVSVALGSIATRLLLGTSRRSSRLNASVSVAAVSALAFGLVVGVGGIANLAPPSLPIASPSPVTSTSPITVSQTPTPLGVTSPTPSTLPPGIPAAEASIVEKVTLKVAHVNPNFGPNDTEIEITVTNRSLKPFTIQFDENNDVAVTDDLNSMYGINVYKRGTIINSGLSANVDIYTGDALSPNARFLIVKFAMLSGASNVAVSYRLQ